MEKENKYRKIRHRWKVVWNIGAKRGTDTRKPHLHQGEINRNYLENLFLFCGGEKGDK